MNTPRAIAFFLTKGASSATNPVLVALSLPPTPLSRAEASSPAWLMVRFRIVPSPWTKSSKSWSSSRVVELVTS